MQLLSDLSEDNLRSRLKEQKNSHIWYMAWPFRNIRSWLHTSVCDDPAVFKSNMEIDQQHKVLIEELEIHILALSSSSIDQAALFSDCLQWIQQTDTHLTTSSNITITDNKLVFFSADKLAAQFERGTQTGGHYPCGSCGVHKQCTDDYVYSSFCNWRSVQELQSPAITGNYAIKTKFFTWW